ncbi:molybdopterin-guanine dinucleotide biosynthesis protein B [Halomonas sp. 18H]|uniref:molybdopterin-guanine dinucleotide biosynthesis protein B n=1 Tax=Halomonas almeriensis TaxID=308163 RepID=UPI00222EDCB6|nr:MULTISPECIES: molybdopterin-guanine dinucleotide biosynthesis protein B [Halomonas]MCW4151184.1 molybdopterin-guanine dinucleotide biosynthesis protein B [Halomonas sp. 18H]MDN3553064.1 molybdopterin-guanine dinucleotide biosynthesis protein B [Halomonas almeriensis]
MTDTPPATLYLPESPALLGIAAWSGTGKTTLLEQLLPALRQRGLRVAVIKHAHHAFDVDTPGKDSHRLREAGATPMLVASRARIALMMETPEREEADLGELIEMVSHHAPDLVLVEGFKAWPLPKLELYREGLGKPALAAHDPWVKAVASQGYSGAPDNVERLDLDDLACLVDWISEWPRRWPTQRVPRDLPGGD